MKFKPHTQKSIFKSVGGTENYKDFKKELNKNIDSRKLTNLESRNFKSTRGEENLPTTYIKGKKVYVITDNPRMYNVHIDYSYFNDMSIIEKAGRVLDELYYECNKDMYILDPIGWIETQSVAQGRWARMVDLFFSYKQKLINSSNDPMSEFKFMKLCNFFLIDGGLSNHWGYFKQPRNLRQIFTNLEIFITLIKSQEEEVLNNGYSRAQWFFKVYYHTLGKD